MKKTLFLFVFLFCIKISQAQNDNLFTSIDDRTILSHLFDSDKIVSEEVLWKPNFYEKMNFEVSDDGYCHTFIDTVILYNNNRLIYIFSTNSEVNSCHACAPKISIATFTKVENMGWKLDFFEKNFRAFGQYGKTGSYGVEKLGDNFYCLKLHAEPYGNAGEFWGSESFYFIDENIYSCIGCEYPIQEVFSYDYLTEKIKIIPLEGFSSHYKIQLTSSNNANETIIENYYYSDERGEYILEKQK